MTNLNTVTKSFIYSYTRSKYNIHLKYTNYLKHLIAYHEEVGEPDLDMLVDDGDRIRPLSIGEFFENETLYTEMMKGNRA